MDGGGGGTLPRLPAASPGPPPYAPVSRHASLNRGGGGGGGGRGSLPPPPLPLVTSLYSPSAERTGPVPLFGAEPPPPPATGMLSRLAQVRGLQGVVLSVLGPDLLVWESAA